VLFDIFSKEISFCLASTTSSSINSGKSEFFNFIVFSKISIQNPENSSNFSTRTSPLEYASAYFLSKGILPIIGTPDLFAKSSMILSSPSERFITIPVGTFICRDNFTASFKSCRPNGVGSVTRTETSASFKDSTTGHPVPGEESIIFIPSLFACDFNSLTIFGARVSPIPKIP